MFDGIFIIHCYYIYFYFALLLKEKNEQSVWFQLGI